MKSILENLSFFTLFNASADPMLLVEAAGQVMHANLSAQQMFDYSENEIVGLKVEALMPDAHRKHHHRYRDAFFQKPQKRSMGNGKNLAVLTSKGKTLPVDIGLSPFEAEGKHFVLVTFHPIEKQMLAESSLSESEERLRLAKLAADLGVFDIDLKLNFVLCDAYIRELWGLASHKAVTYTEFVEAIVPEDRQKWQNELERNMQAEVKRELCLEFRINNLMNQSEHWLYFAGEVFLEAESAVRLLGVVQDVSERKRMEKQHNLLRNEMESLVNQQIAVLTTSAIAHEINQPLAAISAYSEVAMHALEMGAVDKEKLHRSLEGCVRQSQRAGKSLHELLEFLQKGEVNRTPVDLNQTVKEAIDTTQKHGYEGFHSTLDLAPNVPHVLVNYVQLKKVLVNILRNGIEAVKSIGVPIADIQVTVQTQAESNMAQVSIQDNGPGLNDDDASKIFEPFFTTKPDGIGMGLSVSRALIEASGGQLWFDANHGAGATFHLTLPIVK